jgi:predicted NBD/HSP70 family sugar kinase
MAKIYGALEAGGTKFNCAIGTADGEILASARFPTTSPNDTLGAAVDFFRAPGPLAGIGGLLRPTDPASRLRHSHPWAGGAPVRQTPLDGVGYWWQSTPTSTPRFL